ncbi:MAG TPA: carboxypeptidase-like regulatory domain-containing protein [Pyrinomonadaceae bacterium]
MLRRTLTTAVFCLLALLACAARAEACSCVGPDSACAAFGNASAVFVGTVSEVVVKPRNEEERAKGWGKPLARFIVGETFAGIEDAEVWVEGGSGADCVYEFAKGRRYLVYARHTKEGALSAFLCSRTAPAEEAAGDIEFLRALVQQPSGATIWGRVGRVAEGWDEGRTRKVVPVEGVRVTVAGPGGSRDAHIDAEGRYKLTGLAPGRYVVTLELREGLTTRQPERRVEAAERGCAAADFVITDNGRISGRVLDAEGRGVRHLPLVLIDADSKKPDYLNQLWNARTDEQGRYNFTAVPPGRYLFGVRLSKYTASEDPAAEFPRTYYPGVAVASEAEVIELKAGEVLKLRDLRLPPRLAEGVIRVRVVWSDGTPATGAQVLFRETTYVDPGIDQGRPVDNEGQFEIRTRVGSVFKIEATTLVPYAGDPSGTGGTLVRSEPRTLNVANTIETLTLVIKRQK